MNTEMEGYKESSLESSESKHLEKTMARILTIFLQMCHQEISVIREMNHMDTSDVNFQYVPLDDKYNNADHAIEVIIKSSESFLNYKKFKRDLSWIEQILLRAVVNLQKDSSFDDFLEILKNDEMMKHEEQSLLAAKEYNRKQLEKLRFYVENERREWMTIIQNVTEELGNNKDQLNDNMTENAVKISYLKEWEKSKHEQNKMILQNKEGHLLKTVRQMNTESEKEDRVHEEMWSYLENSLQEYKQGINKWMEKYDKDLKEKEQQVCSIKEQLEQQRTKHAEILEKFNERQKMMDEYTEYKLRLKRETEELERRRKAATKIQSWWRGIMFRKGLGPFRRRKGKPKKGGSGKHSEKKEK